MEDKAFEAAGDKRRAAASHNLLTPVVEARGLTRVFSTKAGNVQALRGVELAVFPGELVALRGPSGAGKTTLLNLLLGLDTPTTGQAILLGHSLATLSEASRARLRAQGVGILFQQAHLFPLLTAQENVELILRLSRLTGAQRGQRAREVLNQVGLGPRAHHRGLELSGGEQQRVAIARALVHHPQVIIADEPTGNLDTRTGRGIAALLLEVSRQSRIGALVSTHDAGVAAVADRVLYLRDGLLHAGSP
jgi:putative ABC transport system ATP-binding protein